MASFKEEFWNHSKDVRAGFMEVGGRLFAVSPNVTGNDKRVTWFLTARGAGPTKSAETGKDIRFALSDTGFGLQGAVTDPVSVSYKKAKLDEIWNFVAASWHEDGKKAPDLMRVKFTPKEGDVGPRAENGTLFLFETVNASLKGEKPDLGHCARVAP